MISRESAQRIAHGWIDSWNSHDIDRILSHYSEDIIFSSPFIVKLLGNQSGTIRGKEELKSYFLKGLQAYPELNFELNDILIGVDSITLYYKSVNNLSAAEAMILDSDDKILRVIAHYS
jgi:ketosteroid isomerase-like protein